MRQHLRDEAPLQTSTGKYVTSESDFMRQSYEKNQIWSIFLIVRDKGCLQRCINTTKNI